MKTSTSVALVLLVCYFSTHTAAKPPAYTIHTLKGGQEIGARTVSPEELRNASIALITAFQEHRPSYSRMISVAKSMTAKDRCFNLYSSRVALASVQSGILDSSANAEEFLKNSISSIEAVNGETNVTCEMH